MKKSRVQVGLRIPVDLNDDLTIMAEQQEISKNLLILQILRSWIGDRHLTEHKHGAGTVGTDVGV